MMHGYPGESTHFENHGVSEESFWPSFTDIMMVIVMVFLLVTVSVILNNWSLIGDLKNSIQAQHIASSLAENRQEKNLTLEAKLTGLEKQLIQLNDKYQIEKKNLAEIEGKLLENQDILKKKEVTLASLSSQISELNTTLEDSKASLSKTKTELSEAQSQLSKKESSLNSLQINLDTTLKQKEVLLALSEEQKKTIEDNLAAVSLLEGKLTSTETSLEDLQRDNANKIEELSQLKTSNTKLKENFDSLKTVNSATTKELAELKTSSAQAKVFLASIQTERSKTEEQLNLLKTDNDKLQKMVETKDSSLNEVQQELADIKKSQLAQKSTLTDVETSLQDAEKEKQRIITEMNQRLTKSEEALKSLAESVDESVKQLELKDKEIVALKEQGASQLSSLQGEYDVLDNKYQKLLRPARSSKGKYVVSVTYKKSGKKSIIRLKTNPEGSYKTVSKEVLHKKLAALKKKHKKDLYLKVIIPQRSGLSYNEAWKFTSNLQKKYDYYSQQ